MKMSFTAHLRKQLGDGRVCVRMLQNGHIWQQTYSPISGFGNMLRAGWYTMDTAKQANVYVQEGWELSNLGNCETLDYSQKPAFQR